MDDVKRPLIYMLFKKGDGTEGAGHDLICVTASQVRLREVIESCIHDRIISYCDETGKIPSIPDQIRAVRRDWKVLSRLEFNEHLVESEFVVATDGEII